ncbi:hypothetical protein Q5M85_04490 [Paraclostridium bifermentans]|nr:hypothetical protein [Paraclostridium bifermentans]
MICSFTDIKQCLYMICSNNKIEYVDTDQTFLYVSVKDYYLDKSKIVCGEFLGQIVPGYYLYVTSV